MSLSFWLQNLLFYSLQLALVVVAGGLLATVIKLRNPRIELAYLHGLLALCVLLPVVQPKQTLIFDPDAIKPAVVESRGSSEGQEEANSYLFSWTAFVGGFLIVGTTLRFAWLGIGCLRLTRYRKDSQPLTGLSFLPGLQQELGGNAAVRISKEVRAPVTFGWRRPVVLLPERFLGLDPEIQEAIVVHELLHVSRHDWIVTVFEESIRASLWFHPAIWWLVGRIHLVREQLVDREVIQYTDAKDAYLRALLATAGHELVPDLVPASLFLRKRHLDQRVTAVLRKEIPMSRVRFIASLSTMSAIVVTAVWLASSTFPLQAVPQQTDYGASPLGSVYSPGRWQGVIEQGGEKLLREPQIMYSMEAIDQHIEGRVVLEVSIDRNGGVYDAVVVSGPPELRRDALRSVLGWQYSQDMQLPAKTLVTIRFELPNDDAVAVPSQPPQQPNRIRVGSVVQHARLEHSVLPQYPALAQQARIQGTVDLKLIINVRGGVQIVDVLGGHPLLVPVAVDAIKRWKYRPTLLNGVPIEVETTVAVNFSMSRGVTSGAADPGATPVTP